MDIKECLDDGDGTDPTLRAHKAERHKKCWLQFNKKGINLMNKVGEN
jgi:hypothetical protein